MRPLAETEKDRSGLSKVTATANETNTQKERDFMSKSTFQPGDKVRDTETGDLYTVVSSEDELGFVAFTRDVPTVERIRPRFIEPVEVATVADHEPQHPESELHARLIEWGASEHTTVHQLAQFAVSTDIDVAELFQAYSSLGFIPEGGK